MADQIWHLKGGYFENCNCQILCPCVVPVPPGNPTDGYCDVAFVFHIEEGESQGIAFDGLNFVVAAHTPGSMGDGDWTTALYVDQRASEPQREAMAEILSGRLGGPLAAWMGLTSDFRGIKYVAIDYRSEGNARSVSIPGVMEFAVEGITAGSRRRAPMRLTNVGHPASPNLVMAKGTGNTYQDHGMKWDNTGKNAHYSDFNWSGP